MKILLLCHNPNCISGLAKISRMVWTSVAHGKNTVKCVYTQSQLRKDGSQNGNQFPIPSIIDEKSNLFDYDLLLSIGDLPDIAEVAVSIARKGIKWVHYMGVGGHSYPHIIRYPGYSLYTKDILNHLSAIIHYSEWNTKCTNLSEYLPDEITEYVLPHPVWFTKNDVKHTKSFDFNDVFSPKEKSEWMLYVGVNDHRKGLDLFISYLLQNNDFRAYLHTSDFSPTGFDLVDIRKRLGLEGRLFLRSDLADKMKINVFPDEALISLYKGCDLYFHPHRSEGFGFTPLEAMACGCRVLANPVGGPWSYLPKSNHITMVENRTQYEPDYKYVGVGEEQCGLSKFDWKEYSLETFSKRLVKIISESDKWKGWIEA